MLLERKTISIYAYDFEPTVAITYNVSREKVVEDLQFWIREDYKYNYSVLRKILEMIFQLEITDKEHINEKDIFRTYQIAFDIENCLVANYTVTTTEFRTKKMAHILKPYINFTQTTKQSINIFIKNYIEKGEIK